MVDVGSRKLHARCAGGGSPAVVVEAGLDAPATLMPGWGRVLTEVAPLARICLYDRGNLGKSDFARRPRTAAGAADDLALLLEGLKLPPPYALVGHSFGGTVVRLYAHRHPAQVAGLVLVDPSPDAATMDRIMALLPPERQVEYWTLVSLNRAGIDTRQSYEDVRAIRALPDRPVVLLLAGQTPTNQPPWFPSEDAQRVYRQGMVALVRTSPQAIERVAEQSGHDIPEQDPAAVAHAIREVVKSAQQGQQSR
jgi:pimeloyl-ACP methyl ester carboxylesterase